MKRIEGTILFEFDVCKRVSPDTYTSTSYGCGQTVWLVCVLKENHQCVLHKTSSPLKKELRKSNDVISDWDSQIV